MTIQFGGLATGLDTGTIIEKLMELERQPVKRLENDKTWLNNRLKAFTDLDTRLKSLGEAVNKLRKADTLLQRSVKLSSDDCCAATVSSSAQAGASYRVEVVALAQVQKSVADGVASRTEHSFGTGSLTLTVGGESQNIEITEENNSLQGIMEAINSAELGVTAAIINDGTDTPFRLVLTGRDVDSDFSLTSSLSGGTDSLTIGSPVQEAARAHIRVDGIDIFSNSNTVSEAIPGVTLDLFRAEAGKITDLSVSVDRESIKQSIESFAKEYNEVIRFITTQSTRNEGKGGILSGDSGVSTIKRRLQTMLTTPFANSGVFSTLSELGFETQKDGTLKVNDKRLSEAVDNNLDSMVKLLVGDGGEEGMAGRVREYVDSMTSSSTGMLKGRKDSINSNIRKIDSRIESMEMRLEKRQKILESQFKSMETLVNGLNAQSSYLTQQMNMLSNMMNGGKK
ncbi:MAG: flagellar filament capping protein FliD [Desulfobulbus sp.]|nr:flagellar filament capping protein FliD [Desulfobulbus sp.]